MRHTLTLGARVHSPAGPGMVSALHKAGWVRVWLDGDTGTTRMRGETLTALGAEPDPDLDICPECGTDCIVCPAGPSGPYRVR